jgi:hypothetical protein
MVRIEQKTWLKALGVLLVMISLGALTPSALADSITFTTPAGSNDTAGDPVDAQAVFTTSAGNLHIDLTNLLVNQKDVGQNISDLSFHIASGLSSGSLTSSSGLERTVHGDGTFTDGSSVSTGWKLTPGSTFELDVLGAKIGPAHTILGSPDGSNVYSNANSSIAGNKPHNPFLAGTVSFDIAITGLTASDTVDSATFSFGTTVGDNVPGSGPPPQNPVPEPTSMLLMSGLLGLLGVPALRRRFARA